ncbi:hypothetical protein BU043_11005 [Staphylococcus simulans]|uniref:hypothetical protein n=1 Tax=Staphylococcus simulans TaxID=1286 RepID=UPI000D02FFBC|nr:hypothetical protein [Staphylococcus simulans]PTJ23005.1 hypothetical protein BU039_06240 [Staphylococcus simulans]PTJ26858.1 hypothetical protein BU025_12795 [Staphylococcus simulans]PTJ48636.1 hypothetical protein BU014_03085 [Staphylococcus simulans]PTJ84187.1 hypothetical protein BU051_10715 [Staphylococcus simulans]RIN40014.1 hypothetical protein BU043_11005 [Staphylococcus simulans]
MTKHSKTLIALMPLYLYFFYQGFYAVIYNENPVARVMAVISMLIFTIILTLFITTDLIRNKK